MSVLLPLLPDCTTKESIIIAVGEDTGIRSTGFKIILPKITSRETSAPVMIVPVSEAISAARTNKAK
jgi:hypothetical protein